MPAPTRSIRDLPPRPSRWSAWLRRRDSVGSTRGRRRTRSGGRRLGRVPNSPDVYASSRELPGQTWMIVAWTTSFEPEPPTRALWLIDPNDLLEDALRGSSSRAVPWRSLEPSWPSNHHPTTCFRWSLVSGCSLLVPRSVWRRRRASHAPRPGPPYRADTRPAGTLRKLSRGVSLDLHRCSSAPTLSK